MYLYAFILVYICFESLILINLSNDLDKEKNEIRKKEESWTVERASFKEEVQRANLLASIVQQSLEMNEARLARERERLPEEHKRLLEEQTTRSKILEGSLIEREGALRVEEARRTHELNVRAKEGAEELNRSRMRVEQELSEERAALRHQKATLDQEKAAFEFLMSKEKGELVILNISISRREAALLVEVNTLFRNKGEFELAKGAVEPMLRKTNDDREAGRRYLEIAEKILKDAELQAEGVLLAEKGLHDMEEETLIREGKAENMMSKFSKAQKLLQIEAMQISSMQKELNAERFLLHGAAIELASQASEIRRTVVLIFKYERLSSVMGHNGIIQRKDLNKPHDYGSNHINSTDYDHNHNDKYKGHWFDNKKMDTSDGNYFNKYKNNRKYDENYDENDENYSENHDDNSIIARNAGSRIPINSSAIVKSVENLDNINISMQKLAEKLSKQSKSSINLLEKNTYESNILQNDGASHFYDKTDNLPRLNGVNDMDDYTQNVIEVDPCRESNRNISMRHNDTGTILSSCRINENPNIEDFNLRLSLDSAADFSSGLKAAAAKYGIYK